MVHCNNRNILYLWTSVTQKVFLLLALYHIFYPEGKRCTESIVRNRRCDLLYFVESLTIEFLVMFCSVYLPPSSQLFIVTRSGWRSWSGLGACSSWSAGWPMLSLRLTRSTRDSWLWHLIHYPHLQTLQWQLQQPLESGEGKTGVFLVILYCMI